MKSNKLDHCSEELPSLSFGDVYFVVDWDWPGAGQPIPLCVCMSYIETAEHWIKSSHETYLWTCDLTWCPQQT